MKLNGIKDKAAVLKVSILRLKFLRRIFPFVLGLTAIFWFLIRVIPKPQRASYPCMKVAYPLMSSAVIWLIGITGITTSLKLLILNIQRRKYVIVLITITMVIVTSIIYIVSNPLPLFAASTQIEPVHIPNAPFGKSQGINPGGVVWAWNPNATNENCTNNLANDDGYFHAKNNNQKVIDKMLAQSITKLANKKSQREAWEAIFKYFNKQKGKGNVSYRRNESIFIKINMGCANWSTNSNFSRRKGSIGFSETSPQIILSLLDQLVNEVGVPQNKIIVSDPISHIYSDIYNFLLKEFPDVVYGDRSKEGLLMGRTLLHPEINPTIFYSDKGTILKNKSDCLYSEMQNADYIINVAALKAHGLAGISLTAKNHFGSITLKSAAHLHTGLLGVRNDDPYRNDYGMYRVQVDLMASSYLGRNTLLYVVDGLWGGPEATKAPIKWKMEPFNNDWPNSIFISQDQVAIESVCFDFLRNEAKTGSIEWRNRPNMAQGVDDYLHQAASSEHWPEGIIYDPDNNGKPIPSLGVHEHWNNPIDKDYSRNLGRKEGIELIKILVRN